MIPVKGYWRSNFPVKICQIRGNLRRKIWQSRANPPLKLRIASRPKGVPAEALTKAGVETRRQTPNVWDEGIVQTTKSKDVAKATVVRITDWSLVQSQVGPPNTLEKTPRITGGFSYFRKSGSASGLQFLATKP